MNLSSQHLSGERGMALLLVLVAVMALSLIVAALWESSQPSWEESTLARARYRAGLLAESGVAIALHPRIEPGDVALRQAFGAETGFDARITSEGARIPVNSVEDAKIREAVSEMFVLWGLDGASASTAADSLADWIDEDSEVLPNGAENAFYAGLDYPEFPPNAAFTTLEQMLFVNGMDRVARIQPMWRNYFTVHSEGLIDLNAAPWDVVMALTGTTRDSAVNFVAVRNGDDGVPGTVDDHEIQDAGEVRALLGLSDDEWDAISALVTLSGSVKRIESIGRVGDFTETLVVLAREVQEDGQSTLTPVARFRK
ncbi:MAG: hypothetical protein WD342_20595 [Verrucomicrobiales bacterium]